MASRFWKKKKKSNIKKSNIDVFVSSLLLDESYLTTSVLARALHIKTQKVAISPVYLTGVV